MLRRLNRKEFLLAITGGGAALTLALGTACGRKMSASVTVGPGGLVIGGRSVPLFGGGVEYWSYDPDRWEVLLDRLLRLGINTVGVAVPWSVHELSAGNYDFGQVDPRRDAAGFIRLAGERGFNVLLHPGVFCHLAGGCGVPERLLYDPLVAARTGGGTPLIRQTADGQYPAPSIYSQALLTELGPWCDQLAFNLNPLLYGAGGPVVALMVESALSFFGVLERPYALDYHPDALTAYRGWLEKKYQAIDRLNRTYGTAYQGFEQVEPPREFLAERLDNLPAYLEWVEFRRWRDNQSLDKMISMLAARGLTGVPVIRKAPLPPLPDSGAEQKGPGQIFDCAGGAAALPAAAYALKSAARRTVGGGRYAFRSGLAGGTAFPATQGILSAVDYEFALMLSLMFGLKGWNSVQLIENNGWLAAPVRADGRVRADYFNAYRRVCRLMLESRLEQYERKVESVLLNSRSLDALLAAAGEATRERDLLEQDAALGRLVDLGLKTPVQVCRTWAGQVESLLSDVGFDWDYAVAGYSRRRLAGYKVAILPVSDFIFRDERAALEEYVRSGGTLIYGPGRPWMDESLRQEPATERLFSDGTGVLDRDSGEEVNPSPDDDVSFSGRVIRLESPLGVGDLLKELEIGLPFTRTNTRIELSIHLHPTGRMLLFAANGTERAQRTDIFFQGGYAFRDLLDQSTFYGEGKIRVEIPEHKVQVWEVSG